MRVQFGCTDQPAAADIVRIAVIAVDMDNERSSSGTSTDAPTLLSSAVVP